jgi:dTDP-4-amino-4,6-dideoxygalactose transaminase
VNIPMLNLPRQQQAIGARLYDAVQKVIAEGRFLPNYFAGDSKTPFEERLSSYCRRKYAVGVGSGTAALQIALLACGVEPGDEVITVPNSFFATAEQIIQVGARPVFVDIDPDTHLIDLEAIEGAIGPKTRAILPVHLYGNVVDIKAIQSMLNRRGLEDIIIIEDCAHAVGAWLGPCPVPIGPIGVFSFNPVKNIGGLSDAGAVVTDVEEVAYKAQVLRNHGRTSKNNHTAIGFNSRLNCINDCVLTIKMDYLDQWNERRREIAERYNQAFENVPQVVPVKNRADVSHAYHQYVICVKERDTLRRCLKQAGIDTDIHYPALIPEQRALKVFCYSLASLSVAVRLNRQILSIPCYPELTDSEVELIIERVREFEHYNKDRLKPKLREQ